MEDKQETPDMKEMKGNTRPSSLLPALLCGALTILALGGAQVVVAGNNDAKDFSNIPMEMRQNSAPANIMYILDDSGSMHDNRVGIGSSSLLNDGTSDPVPAWLFARHDTNTLYYDPSREYAPWPGLEKGSSLPRIPLAKITAAPNWPEIPSELSTCATDNTQHLRNTAYTAYNGKDGSGETTRDMTATATWYTSETPQTFPYLDYADASLCYGSPRSYDYNISYGYFPAANSLPDGKPLPATHYFVCKDKNKSCTTVTEAWTFSTPAPTTPGIATDNELWLVVLRHNIGGAPQRQFYKVSALTPEQHIVPFTLGKPSGDTGCYSPGEPAKYIFYVYQLQESNLDGPYNDNDAKVPDEVKPHWTRPDGTAHNPTPTEELENFLQWYVYHSTRNFETMNAIATSLQELSGVNVGMYSINTAANYGGDPKLRIGVMPVKVGETDRSDYLLCRLYNYYAKDGVTPFTQAYEQVGRYFDMSRTASSDTFVVGDDQGKKKPYEDDANGGSCQQAFIINFTDGVFDYWPLPYYSYPYKYVANDSPDGDGDGRVIQTSISTADCPDPPTQPVKPTPPSRPCKVALEKSESKGSCGCLTTPPADTGICPKDNQAKDPCLNFLPSVSTPIIPGTKYCGSYYSSGPTACCAQCVTYSCPEYDDNDPSYQAALDDYNAKLADYNVKNADYQAKLADYNAKKGTCEKTTSTFWPTISDFAKYYYANDLAPDVHNYVPTTARDKNSFQHIVTYSVSLGVYSSLTNSYYDQETKKYYSYTDYRDDPYFDNHPQPKWGSTSYATDFLWQASFVSKGIFYNVTDAGALTTAFRSIVANIGASPEGVGAAAVNNGGRLNDTATIYVGRYNTTNWTGQLAAYPVSKLTGKIGAKEIWEASKKLKERTPDNRLIFTSDGNGEGLNFTEDSLNAPNGLTAGQKQMLGYAASGTNTFADNIRYIRGGDVSGLRKRDNILGDIIHSSPVLLRSAAMGVNDPTDPGTIYVGANDGMLHAFDVKTGEERFAFIPSQAHDHLLALGASSYGGSNHRYYIDATPVAGRMTFFDDTTKPMTRTRDMRFLVSGLGRGGRGYFALKVADIAYEKDGDKNVKQKVLQQAENINSATSMSDVTNMLQWEYPTRDMIVTPPVSTRLEDKTDQPLTLSSGPCTYKTYNEGGQNNPDGDGDLYCADGHGTQVLAYRDADLGYSYSAPVIFPSNNRKKKNVGLLYPSGNQDHPWVVVFGNGYGSESGKAVLYVLDALSGKLIKKIDTMSDPSKVSTAVKNGLSSPAELDVDNDGQVDFVYAGDLYGNLWKFDFRSTEPKDWDVVRNSAGDPQPLFSTMQGDQLGQPITSRPDIVAHNKKKGYIIVFGTGQFIGPSDFDDTKTQSLFGIWDSDIPSADIKLTKYLGAWKRDGESKNSFSDGTGTFPNASLLKQKVRFQGTPLGAQCGGADGCPEVRVVSNNLIKWYNKNDTTTFPHVGWYLDLPGLEPIEFDSAPASSSAKASERIIDDVRIRYGKVIALSFTPSGEGVCSAGGSSVLMELSAFNGGGPKKAQLNLGSGTLGKGDYFSLGGDNNSFTASGLIMNGKATMPTIIPGVNPKTEYKVQFDNSGVARSTLEDVPSPALFWREASQN